MSKEELLKELKTITKLLTLSNADQITSELEKLTTTKERKMIWVNIDGKRTNEDITKICGAGGRTIRRYRKVLENADLIENPRGKPAKKKLNYTPPSWIELIIDEKGEDPDNG